MWVGWSRTDWRDQTEAEWFSSQAPLSRSLTLTLSLSLSLSLSHTHKHTHKFLSHTHTHTLSLSLSPALSLTEQARTDRRDQEEAEFVDVFGSLFDQVD